MGHKFSASWTAASNAERYTANFSPSFDLNVSGYSVDDVNTTFETPHVIDAAGRATFRVTSRALGSTTQPVETAYEKSLEVHFQ